MEARLTTTNLSPFPIFFLYGFSGSFAFFPTLLRILILCLSLVRVLWFVFPHGFRIVRNLEITKAEVLTNSLFSFFTKNSIFLLRYSTLFLYRINKVSFFLSLS